jgi:hypothetical protein
VQSDPRVIEAYIGGGDDADETADETVDETRDETHEGASE